MNFLRNVSRRCGEGFCPRLDGQSSSLAGAGGVHRHYRRLHGHGDSESQRILPRKPEVTIITSFAEGRTDAEIEASNIANQKKQDEWRAQLADYEELRKENWRQLGRATGVDVDKIEREIEQERAAEAAAEKKKRDDLQAARARLDPQ